MAIDLKFQSFFTLNIFSFNSEMKKTTTMETPRYLRFNKHLLACAGLWPHQQKLTKNIFFIILLFLVISQTTFQVNKNKIINTI